MGRLIFDSLLPKASPSQFILHITFKLLLPNYSRVLLWRQISNISPNLLYSWYLWHQYLHHELEVWDLLALIFFYIQRFKHSTVKCLIYIHKIELKDSTHQPGIQNYPIHKFPQFPKLFSSCSSVPLCLSEAVFTMPFILTLWLLYMTCTILKGPISVQSQLICRILMIKLTPHPTGWK